MELTQVVKDIVDALVALDCSGVPLKQFPPGVGPRGEPQLVRRIADHLDSLSQYAGTVQQPAVAPRGIQPHSNGSTTA